MSFASNLRDSIFLRTELERLTAEFHRNPHSSIETSLTYAEAKSLGFVVSDSYQGTFVSLPQPTQYDDH